jgi:hypothetical protein
MDLGTRENEVDLQLALARSERSQRQAHVTPRPLLGNTGHLYPATEWPEREARFYKVATIHIPRQTFDAQERDAFGEKLSFNPWHALPEHKPLGITNRLRKVIYERIDLIRREASLSARPPEKR